MLTFGSKLPFRLGRLPSEIVIKGEKFTFFFPLATSVLLSVVLSVILWLFRRK